MSALIDPRHSSSSPPITSEDASFFKDLASFLKSGGSLEDAAKLTQRALDPSVRKDVSHVIGERLINNLSLEIRKDLGSSEIPQELVFALDQQISNPDFAYRPKFLSRMSHTHGSHFLDSLSCRFDALQSEDELMIEIGKLLESEDPRMKDCVFGIVFDLLLKKDFRFSLAFLDKVSNGRGLAFTPSSRYCFASLQVIIRCLNEKNYASAIDLLPKLKDASLVRKFSERIAEDLFDRHADLLMSELTCRYAPFAADWIAALNEIAKSSHFSDRYDKVFEAFLREKLVGGRVHEVFQLISSLSELQQTKAYRELLNVATRMEVSQIARFIQANPSQIAGIGRAYLEWSKEILEEAKEDAAMLSGSALQIKRLLMMLTELKVEDLENDPLKFQTLTLFIKNLKDQYDEVLGHIFFGFDSEKGLFKSILESEDPRNGFEQMSNVVLSMHASKARDESLGTLIHDLCSIEFFEKAEFLLQFLDSSSFKLIGYGNLVFWLFITCELKNKDGEDPQRKFEEQAELYIKEMKNPVFFSNERDDVLRDIATRLSEREEFNLYYREKALYLAGLIEDKDVRQELIQNIRDIIQTEVTSLGQTGYNQETVEGLKRLVPVPLEVDVDS